MDLVALWNLVAAQHGAVHVLQAAELGVSRATVRTLVDRGHLVRAAPRVLLAAGSLDSPGRRAMVAVLDAGRDAFLSHESAAAWWTVPGFRLEPWHVMRARRAKDDEGCVAVVHEPRRLRPSHVVRRDGVPVTTPSRTIFDLASCRHIHPGRVARALDTMWSMRLVDPPSLERMLEDLQGRGRPGIRLMRHLIAERGSGYVAPESALERRFLDICERAGITGFRRQVVVGDDAPIGRVDYVHEQARLVVEIDSDRFHTSLLDRQADELRDRRLAAAGYRVLRFTEADVWYGAAELERILRTALQAA